jgi:hypothetical protein
VRVLDELGQVHEQLGDFASARNAYERALAQVPLEARSTRGRLVHRLAHACRSSDPARARALFLECAALADTEGDARAAALSRAMIGQIDITSGDLEGGMSRLLAALVELPAGATERSHLIEHAAYLSERLPRGLFQQILESHVPPGSLAVSLMTAVTERRSSSRSPCEAE